MKISVTDSGTARNDFFLVINFENKYYGTIKGLSMCSKFMVLPQNSGISKVTL